jgi:oxygen-dependent protoporphyrinogen oxidase
MRQFVNAIAAQLRPECVALNCPVSEVHLEAAEWRVASDNSRGTFTDLILALPAYTSANLLKSHNAELAGILENITYSNSITVALGYSAGKLPKSDLPSGFGFLVPRSEGRRMIACTFVQNKFSYRVPEDRVLIRAFLTDGLEKSDTELQSIIERELVEILAVKATPDFASIARWPCAMPQYEVGHLEKISAIDKMVGAIPKLRLIGNAYRGIGIPDCVREGKQAAEKILAG